MGQKVLEWDGNSQEYHHEVCLLDATYMVDNSADPQLSCFLNGETMDSYIEQSHMQSLGGAWATESEIIAAASLLQTTIHV